MQTALVTMFGFLLFCMMYIAFGIFASSLTENQIIAAIISIAFFIITWVLPDFNTNLSGLSFVNMLYKYTQGEIDIADTVTFITAAITSIVLTITLMQRRKKCKIRREKFLDNKEQKKEENVKKQKEVENNKKIQ